MTTTEPTSPVGATDSDDAVAAPGGQGVNAGPTRMQFGLMLGAIAVVGVVIRAIYIEQFAPSQHIFPDSFWYYAQARNLRLGRVWGIWNPDATASIRGQGTMSCWRATRTLT